MSLLTLPFSNLSKYHGKLAPYRRAFIKTYNRYVRMGSRFGIDPDALYEAYRGLQKSRGMSEELFFDLIEIGSIVFLDETWMWNLVKRNF